MSYESATYINELDKNLPRGSDSISEGDIHLRTIKDVLKQSFPNVDSPVNAIHTGATAPVLHSAGTVWFDTSSGLVKMRDTTNTHWLNMAHGEAGGIGSTLKIEWVEWGQTYDYRHSTPTLIRSHMVSPLSPTSVIVAQLTASVSAWGANEHQQTWGQFRDVTNDVDITSPIGLIGFNHVNDPGIFEIYSSVSMIARYSPHPPGDFELGLYSWSTDSADGGADMNHMTCMISEIE
jgi:hypothetical protein